MRSVSDLIPSEAVRPRAPTWSRPVAAPPARGRAWRAGGIGLWLLAAFGLATAGCTIHPGSLIPRTKACSHSRTADCAGGNCPELDAVNLPQVPLADRPDLLWERLPLLTGSPLEIAEASSARLLSWEELRRLARRGDSTAQLLARPLPCLPRTEPPVCLENALSLQAEHAGSLAIARAGEAFLGLQECYLQNELLERAREGSDRRERMLRKFRESGIPVELDARELDRQRLELDRQFALLAREYQAATVGLELLLNLPHEPTVPIWPIQSRPQLALPGELPDCLELAQLKRADRQALLALQGCLETAPPEQLAGLGGSLSPWSGLTVPPTPAARLFCLRADWEEAARGQYRAQLCALLQENLKQVTLEVNLAFGRLWAAREQLRIADGLVASLQCSLEDVEQLRSLEPVNVEQFLELEQRLMTAQSQRVTAVIEQAKSELELAKAVGVLDF